MRAGVAAAMGCVWCEPPPYRVLEAGEVAPPKGGAVAQGEGGGAHAQGPVVLAVVQPYVDVQPPLDQHAVREGWGG